jgi:hypothetical protein
MQIPNSRVPIACAIASQTSVIGSRYRADDNGPASTASRPTSAASSQTTRPAPSSSAATKFAAASPPKIGLRNVSAPCWLNERTTAAPGSALAISSDEDVVWPYWIVKPFAIAFVQSTTIFPASGPSDFATSTTAPAGIARTTTSAPLAAPATATALAPRATRSATSAASGSRLTTRTS